MHDLHMQIEEHYTPIRLHNLGAEVVDLLAVKGEKSVNHVDLLFCIYARLYILPVPTLLLINFS